MSQRSRTFIAAVSFALLAIPALAGSALAGSGDVTQYPVDEAWCFQDQPYTYCFEMTGQFTFVDQGGMSVANGTLRNTTHAYENGDHVSTSVVQSVSQWKTKRDGTGSTLEIEHSRYESDAQTCVATAVLRISGYEIVVDHWQVSCH